ncbi:MAG TPA: M12 family metallo-peptidase, partial [Thermoanaerobaculia bacterium]|nr:M12 family metallo-peptidase [Thermoanaerobaculia bacterium]
MSSRSWRHAVAAALAIVPALLAAPAPLNAGVVFREAFVSEARPSARRAGVVRSREVAVSLDELEVTDLPRGVKVDRRREVTLNLFDDAWFPVRLEAVERDLVGSTVWYGRVTGDPRSSVTIALKEGRMSVSISSDSKRFTVRPLDNGLHEASELRSDEFPTELDPTPTFVADVSSGDVVTNDDGSTWDILVAYTNIVRNAYGSAAAVESLISNAIASTNTAYANSGVTSRVRLVGAMETAYDDRTADFSTTLGRLRNSSDGFMDAIVAQRDAVGADAVSLLVYNPTNNACGVGYLMTSPGPAFAANAFNVTRDDCAVGNFSFAHELGHNFGLEHDRNNAGPVASYTYAFGYQDPFAKFRDIMAYSCPGGCPRLQYFSNPEVTYLGRPFGVLYTEPLAADNRRALNNNAAIISNWRQTVVASISFTDDPLVAGTTVVKAIHINELRMAINSKRAAAGLAPASWATTIEIGGTISAAHITEMRTALTAALPT